MVPQLVDEGYDVMGMHVDKTVDECAGEDVEMKATLKDCWKKEDNILYASEDRVGTSEDLRLEGDVQVSLVWHTWMQEEEHVNLGLLKYSLSSR